MANTPPEAPTGSKSATQMPLDPQVAKKGPDRPDWLPPEYDDPVAYIEALKAQAAKAPISAQVADVRDSGTWRLEAPHYWVGDILLEAGTLVGDGTPYPLWEGFRPNFQMTEVTDEQPPPAKKPAGVPGQGGRSR